MAGADHRRLYEPMAEGVGIGAGIGERMKQEDRNPRNDRRLHDVKTAGPLGNQLLP
jgi:hypothetical protein